MLARPCSSSTVVSASVSASVVTSVFHRPKLEIGTVTRYRQMVIVSISSMIGRSVADVDRINFCLIDL